MSAAAAGEVFAVHWEPNCDGARRWLETNTPAAVVLEATERASCAEEMVAYIRANERLGRAPIIASHDARSGDVLETLLSLGVDDFVGRPLRAVELLTRIRAQLRRIPEGHNFARQARDQQILLELTETLASSLDIRDILFAVVRRVANVAGVDRCSIVLAGDEPAVGYVVATSDDETLRDLPLDLKKYPEIQEVLATGRPLVIPDAERHPLLEIVRQTDPSMSFSSVALIPILHDHDAMGALFLRARTPTTFPEHQLSLLRAIANTTAIALRSARMLKSLRDQTRQMTHARVEAERRVQLFQRYADFFESAAEGMVVIDRPGRILFTNPRAREITGFSETELMSSRIDQLLSPHERGRAGRLLRGFRDGVYPRGVDLELRTHSGQPITISVSFSSVLHEDNAILFTFRDVTRERRIAIELKQTKEFLERVIDSSVDGIAVADLRGRVLLFNRAASRIFGYAPTEVLGKLAVERLYPPGVARQVMRKIRDPKSNGYGRLEDFRVDMLNSAGEAIPVLLSAALVMENGEPVGSVGIFTDIRQRLSMEAQLERAQEELREREKQAIVAELAGAAAHELNQPLTSVIGYAELLLRKLHDDEQLTRAASVIVTESERMAEIVRKVGKITKYETKSYVGSAKIVDLDKASGTGSDAQGARR